METFLAVFRRSQARPSMGPSARIEVNGSLAGEEQEALARLRCLCLTGLPDVHVSKLPRTSFFPQRWLCRSPGDLDAL